MQYGFSGCSWKEKVILFVNRMIIVTFFKLITVINQQINKSTLKKKQKNKQTCFWRYGRQVTAVILSSLGPARRARGQYPFLQYRHCNVLQLSPPTQTHRSSSDSNPISGQTLEWHFDSTAGLFWHGLGSKGYGQTMEFGRPAANTRSPSQYQSPINHRWTLLLKENSYSIWRDYIYIHIYIWHQDFFFFFFFYTLDVFFSSRHTFNTILYTEIEKLSWGI